MAGSATAVPPTEDLRFNGGVLAVAVIGALALAGAVVAGVTWRRGGDERQSVRQ